MMQTNPKSHSKAVFFDLDDTIFDHRSGQSASLAAIISEYQLPEQAFLTAYRQANARLWHLYETGEATRDEVRHGRMVEALAKCDRTDLDGRELTARYFHHYVKHDGLIAGAASVLKQLCKKAHLGVITNGFTDIQNIKLQSTGLAELLDVCIISEEFGYLKPHPKIFTEACSRLKLDHRNCTFVGDTYSTDILGANAAGWHAIWYNPDALHTPDNASCIVVHDWEQLHSAVLHFLEG